MKRKKDEEEVHETICSDDEDNNKRDDTELIPFLRLGPVPGGRAFVEIGQMKKLAVGIVELSL